MFVIFFLKYLKAILKEKNLDCVINTTGSCFFLYYEYILCSQLSNRCSIHTGNKLYNNEIAYRTCGLFPALFKLFVHTYVFVYQHENFTFSHTDTIQIFPTCSKPLAPRVYDNQHLKVNNSLMTNILVVYLECVEQFCISLNRSCYK